MPKSTRKVAELHLTFAYLILTTVAFSLPFNMITNNDPEKAIIQESSFIILYALSLGIFELVYRKYRTMELKARKLEWMEQRAKNDD